jgi:antitoxin component YwqK of YwqJK toxin-antitoxin module
LTKESVSMDKHLLGKLYYDSGELRYEGFIKNDMPCGQGTSYYKNGHKHMDGQFGDWFIEYGKEYYESGVLKFFGKYNSGAKTYYGPRYFVDGKLYFESGGLWYEGTFDIKKHGSLGYPLFKGSQSFLKGIEHVVDGHIVKIHKRKR